jgi:hypothetical protein
VINRWPAGGREARDELLRSIDPHRNPVRHVDGVTERTIQKQKERS